MDKFLPFFFLLSSFVNAQSTPTWVNNLNREYPQKDWIAAVGEGTTRPMAEQQAMNNIPTAYNGYFAAVLDSDTVNAFATPGGHIFLTRGLINTAKSEEALAAIIAHEIAHIQLKHGVISVQTTRDLDTWFNLLTTTGPTSITSRLNAGYSRIQEFDADITALSLLADAGYNTTGLLDMLKELEKAQSGIRGGFNDTHPSPASRLTNAKVAALRYANCKL